MNIYDMKLGYIDINSPLEKKYWKKQLPVFEIDKKIDAYSIDDIKLFLSDTEKVKHFIAYISSLDVCCLFLAGLHEAQEMKLLKHIVEKNKPVFLILKTLPKIETAKQICDLVMESKIRFHIEFPNAFLANKNAFDGLNCNAPYFIKVQIANKKTSDLNLILDTYLPFIFNYFKTNNSIKIQKISTDNYTFIVLKQSHFDVFCIELIANAKADLSSLIIYTKEKMMQLNNEKNETLFYLKEGNGEYDLKEKIQTNSFEDINHKLKNFCHHSKLYESNNAYQFLEMTKLKQHILDA